MRLVGDPLSGNGARQRPAQAVRNEQEDVLFCKTGEWVNPRIQIG